MFGVCGNESFFLTEEQLKTLPKYFIDLNAEAAVLLKNRGDFTFEELLNSAFLRGYNDYQLYLKCEADNQQNGRHKNGARFKSALSTRGE